MQKTQMDFDQQARLAMAVILPVGMTQRIFNTSRHAKAETFRENFSLQQLMKEIFSPLPQPVYSLTSLFVIALISGAILGDFINQSPLDVWFAARDEFRFLEIII